MNSKTFIRRADRHSVDLRVADLSYGGCQIRSEDAFSAGEVVELRIIKRGAAAAEIRWSTEGRAGVRFIN